MTRIHILKEQLLFKISFMKKIILLFLFISVISLTFGQSRQGLHKVDSLQIYNSNKSIYEFSMIKNLQGFFWDSICYQSKPYVEVNIVNDSKHTLINYYLARDSRILWLEKKGKYNDTLLPGQSITLKSLWPDSEPKGTFYSPIRLKYKIGDSIYTNTIEVWGSVYPSTDKIISTSIAISEQSTFEIPNSSLQQDSINLSNNPYGLGCYETIRYLKKDGTIKKEILFDNNGRRTIIIYKRNKKKIKTKYSKKWVMNSLPHCGMVIEIKE